MKKSSLAPGKGSKIKNRLGTNTTATTNTEIVITIFKTIF
ncbi:hypothetical protein RHORCCE3_1476 [Rickettsia hoogstraalii str. RCCE3]|nr:hypothetical protein RHORCCE3_1476 [Rickettsia hoogstraalii str. RCCE3]